jgi:hypothetical protein
MMRVSIVTARSDQREVSSLLPPAADYQQSAGRLRWLVNTGREATVAIVENEMGILAWAILERSADGWVMWKGPGGAQPEPQVLSLIAQALRPLSECMLVLDPSWHFGAVLNDWQADRTYRSSLVDVRREDAILLRMKPATRRRVLHAQREGAQAICDDACLLDNFYPMYSECMRQAGSPDFASYEEMHSLTASEGVHLFTVLLGSRVIAGSVCTRNSNSLEARYVATAFSDRAIGGLNLAHFAAMLWAHRKGLHYFDLSGIAIEPCASKLAKINRFKLGFGGEGLDYPIYR